jgi:hypothetical protein
MRRWTASLILIVLMLGIGVPGRPYTLQNTGVAANIQIKWVSRQITVGFSNSLRSPPSNIKAGSDIIGAANRALARWSQAAPISFIVSPTNKQSVSPGDTSGDGITVITVANTSENLALFQGSDRPARTRVFFNPDNGAITEADVVVNPNVHYLNPGSQDDPNNGVGPGFSTDGSPFTYDLEAVLTHEIGHLLGLEHSANLAATMQPRLGRNNLYGSPAMTVRTLSDDDRAAIRSIYGPKSGGAIGGKVTFPGAVPSYGAHVWLEDVGSGKVFAGNVTLSNGAYYIDSVPSGRYRVSVEYLGGPVVAAEIPSGGGSYLGLLGKQPGFRTTEASQPVDVIASEVVNLNISLPAGAQLLKPREFGINGELSSVAVPVSAGKTYTVYVTGEGVDRVLASGISVQSPFFHVDQPSLVQHGNLGTPFPIISFDVRVSPTAQAGDYSIRLQSAAGEVAYMAGGLTIDPGVNSSFNNAVDDPSFFIAQHYLDFLGREPDQAGLDYWASQIAQCGADSSCIAARRITVSAAFFAGQEFQQTGSVVYRLYKASFGRTPSFEEFTTDRDQVEGGSDAQMAKRNFAELFVQRPEFIEQYPLSMSVSDYVDHALLTINRLGVDLSNHREELISEYNNSAGQAEGRAKVLLTLVEYPEFKKAEYNRAFVLMQYFAYLKRDPDPKGYQFWLNTLNEKPAGDSNGYRAMVCAFLTSAEYQLRFGTLVTRTNAECGE